MQALEIINLSKTYTGKRLARVQALTNLSLDIAQGEVFGFLGPNGAGKSTTIKALMGLIRPSSGSARIMGLTADSCAARKHVGYLPENPTFYDYLTGEEYLRFVGSCFAMPRDLLAAKSEECLKLLGLWDDRKRPLRGYSKGMVQRVGLAQVLLHDPHVYILDEPMSGLDPVGRAMVKDIILSLKERGKAVFFSTHITSDVEAVCDRVGIIYRGELQTVAQVDTLLAEGIEGYHVHFRATSSGPQEDVFIAGPELAVTVARIHASGGEISLVEPKRKNLEDFFLATVKGQ